VAAAAQRWLTKVESLIQNAFVTHFNHPTPFNIMFELFIFYEIGYCMQLKPINKILIFLNNLLIFGKKS